MDALLRLVLKPLALRTLKRGVPFAVTCGVVIDRMASAQSLASIAPRSELLTDNGTWQEGAVFTLAETASGAAMTSIFLPVILKCRPVVSSATFCVLKASGQPLQASTRVAASEQALLQRLRTEKKIAFDVEVDVVEQETRALVACMKASWHLSLR